LDELYFPTGLALDTAALNGNGEPKYLYVVNSDFDLQYRSASVISYDLDALLSVVPKNCRTSADCTNDPAEERTVCDAPGPDGFPTDGLPEDAWKGLLAKTDPLWNPSYHCVAPQLDANGYPKVCGDFAEQDPANGILYPGRCPSVVPTTKETGDGAPPMVRDTVGIGAFATDVMLKSNPDDANQSRLFIPVRGDSTLHWIDVQPGGQLECGADTSEDGNCDDRHRAGNMPATTDDHLVQPAEPFAIDGTNDGAYVGVTNQTTGTVSLYRNDWGGNTDPNELVQLVSIATGLPVAPVGIAAVPELENQSAGHAFLVTYRSAPQIDLLRVHEDKANDGEMPDPTPAADVYNRYTLRRTGSVLLTANSLGFDSRGIAIDSSDRDREYLKCEADSNCSAAADPAACRASCIEAAPQSSVFVASRAPASLLVGAMTEDSNYTFNTNDLPSFTDSIALTFGPSRVIVGDVRVPTTATDRPFDLEKRVFVVCFDSRRIVVYDPKRRRIEANISTGRGPHALAVDSKRGLAYVGHFTDSYLGIISLDQRFPQTYATIVASIGSPKAPRSSK